MDLIPKVKPGEVFDWTACHMDAGHPQINSGPADCPPPASGKSRAWKYSIVVNKGQDLRELSLDPVIIIEE